jgi:hypothetical protein
MRRLLWLFVAALLTAGCATASGRQAGDARPRPLPLGGAVYFTAAESAALHRAEERYVQTCMRQRGFTYRRAAAGHRRLSPPSPYGLLTAEQAAQDGYGFTSRRLDGSGHGPNEEHLASLPRAARRQWTTALKGAPGDERKKVVVPGGPTVTYAPESCVHVAQRRLYGDGWLRQFYTVQELRNEVVRNVLDRPAVGEAERDWSACMREAGFDSARRSEVRTALRRQVQNAADAAALRAVGEREMRTARQDAACQAEVLLAERVATGQRRVEAALPEEQTSGLDAFRAARRAALAQATDGGSPPADG